MVLLLRSERLPRRAIGTSIAVVAATALLSIINVPAGSAQQAAPTPPPSAAQKDADQIQAVSQQIAQTAQDPGMPADIKTQMMDGLATQFNQLVAIWQRDVAAGAAASGAIAPTSPTSAVPSSPTPVASASTGAAMPAPPPDAVSGLVGAGPPPEGAPPTPGSPQSADQLRSQALSISQQMNSVSQDPTLASDSRTAQLNALAAQFNQLMLQLQQSGG